MKLSLIVAMASNYAIGLNNQMPWHLSADLKRFKQITLNSVILMGRKTHESIGRPLPERTNVIISQNPTYQATGCQVFNSIEQALNFCRQFPNIFVIGGASLYQRLLPKADKLYLTQIHQDFEGDTFFPIINQVEWQEVSRETIKNDPRVNFSYSFIELERNQPL